MLSILLIRTNNLILYFNFTKTCFMFKKFFSSTIFPILFILIGLSFILLSIWGDLQPLWHQTWDTLGKTIFVSGAFAGLLKLMQIHGVFKEELEKLIFEPKFLTNRKDIPNYWEKISQELFKNKFPNIRTKLLNDIKDTYMPTKEIVYYDKAEHFIEITLDSNKFLTTKKTTTLTIICTDGKKIATEYEFTTAFTHTETNEQSYSNTSVKINGEYVVGTVVEDGTIIQGEIIHKVKVPLIGCDEYELEREDCIKCKIDEDDLILFRAAKLTNTLIVTINHSPNLEIVFIKVGTLDKYNLTRNTNNIKKYEYRGIIYKEQGYIIKVKEK